MIIDQNDTCPRPKGQNQLLKMVVLIFALHFFQSPPTKLKFNMIATFDTQRMKMALMPNAGNVGPDQTAHCAVWSGPSLPAYRLKGYCWTFPQTEKVKVWLRRCAVLFEPLLFTYDKMDIFLYRISVMIIYVLCNFNSLLSSELLFPFHLSKIIILSNHLIQKSFPH